MEKRMGITILLCVLSILTSFAQWTSQDSIKLQEFLSGDKEIKLNDAAVKSIRFGIPKEQMPTFEPIMYTDNPSLKFKEDLPDIFTDSLSKHKSGIVLRPYNIFTKYNEDPIHMPANCFTKTWAAKNLYNKNFFDPRMQPARAGRGANDAQGAGVSYSFSMEDVLQYLFSKKGRAKMRNTKNANAWKTY